ncbi:ATP-grasp domain-containing protein [Methanomethylovorans sp.]|uniref:ATP-grasp domain-containing protein n=1 Tax=Methanomethylovorans sp. TaxID=2758717 RepID=UPI00351C25FE
MHYSSCLLNGERATHERADRLNVLVIGFSTRNIVCSGSKAGYNMYAIDAFCDQDTVDCCIATKTLPKDLDIRSKDAADMIFNMILSFEVDFDAVVPGSGFESMDFSSLPWVVLASDPERIQMVQDKFILSRRLAELGYPHPHVYENIDDKPHKFPVIVKPRKGGGGIFNRIAWNEQELLKAVKEILETEPSFCRNDLMMQEFIQGLPASVSLIASKDKAVALAVNEQIIGTPWLTRMQFAYCGNITPYEGKYAEEMCNISEKLISELGLLGSVGIDFIVREDGPEIIEVNPRFQGSLDTVELATGMNLFDAHVKAFRGELPVRCRNVQRSAGRCIIYADRDIRLDAQVLAYMRQQQIVDIPQPGYTALADYPVTSVLHTGANRDEVLNSLKCDSEKIKILLDN